EKKHAVAIKENSSCRDQLRSQDEPLGCLSDNADSKAFVAFISACSFFAAKYRSYHGSVQARNRETLHYQKGRRIVVPLLPGVPFAHWKRALPGKMHIYETKD